MGSRHVMSGAHWQFRTFCTLAICEAKRAVPRLNAICKDEDRLKALDDGRCPLLT